MKKKGAGHIEMVLSFVIFIGFVGLAFFFFNPVNNTRVVDSALDYATIEVSKDITTIAEIYSVNLKDSYTEEANPETPISCPDTISIGLDGILGKSVAVFNKDGKLTASGNLGNIVAVNKADNFVTIVLSEEIFTTALLSTGEDNPECYEISSSDTLDLFSESKAKELESRYNTDYNAVKKEFNLLSRTDFKFSLKSQGINEINVEKAIPEGFEVFADSRSEQVLNTTGSIEYGELIVQIW